MNILFVLQRYPGFGGIETVTKLLSEENKQWLAQAAETFTKSFLEKI